MKKKLAKLKRAVRAAIDFLPVTDKTDRAGNWGLTERERKLFNLLRNSLR